MKTAQMIFGANAGIYILAFGMTGKIMYAIAFAFCFFMAWICFGDRMFRQESEQRQAHERETIEMLRTSENCKILHDLHKDATRRHLIDEWEKL